MTVNENRDAPRQGFLAFMCDHLVSLSGAYIALNSEGADEGEPRFFALTGFVLVVRGKWCLLTAGHAVQEIENAIGAGKFRLTNCCIAAHFGSNPAAARTIPFDFHACGRLSVNDESEGIDFALLALEADQQAALVENGIRPISEANWKRQRLDACEVFALLGLPCCLVPEHDRLVPHGDSWAGLINPVLVAVRRVELSPEEMPPSTYPWFVGTVGAADDLPDITGMSGGPIFGFFHGEDGLWQYWIVAIQSRWNREKRILFGCPIPVVGQLVEEQLRRFAEVNKCGSVSEVS